VGGCLVSNKFPNEILKWCELIDQSSKKYGVPNNLIASVILQESGGNPNAYSTSGAVGLMQIMPKDGIASEFICNFGKPCFENRPTMEELYDPKFNIDYGTRMLANLYKQEGNWKDALFRYGPMDVDYYYADIVLKIWNQYIE
jgi:soluble lytic murein transglycosylase-like protein